MRYLCSALLLFLLFSSTNAQVDSTYIRARFPGGDRAFAIYWDRNFEIPMKFRFDPPDGEGVVRFEVNIDGSIQNVSITRSLVPELDQSALEAVRKMPRWEPGRQGGEPVLSYIEYSYFVLIDRNGSKRVEWSTKEAQAVRGGLYIDLWAGAMIHTNDWGHYFNPVRPSMGIEFGYRFGPWSVGAGWDVLSVSKVKQPFVLEMQPIEEGMRLSPLYFYLPLRYRFETASKWTIAPMIAPTINHLEINKRESGDQTIVETVNFFSLATGLHVGKRLFVREYYNPVKRKMRYESTYASARLMVNFANLHKKTSTAMKGAAISLGFSFSGWLQAGKKLNI